MEPDGNLKKEIVKVESTSDQLTIAIFEPFSALSKLKEIIATYFQHLFVARPLSNW